MKTSGELLRPERTFTTDKEFVKHYIASRLGEAYNIPTLAVLRSEEEIRQYSFPERCVIKPTHLCEEVILRKNGEPVPEERILSWLGENYYEKGRESNYRYLTPKVIVEPFVFDCDVADDIKFFCHKGRVRLIQWDFDRHACHTRKLYTRDWRDLQTSLGYPLSPKDKEPPRNLEEMIRAVEMLAGDFELIRMDLYTNDQSFYCGEMTHCHGNAGERFVPLSHEKLISDILFK